MAKLASSSEFLALYESAHRDPKNRSLHHIAHFLAVIGIIVLPWRAAIGVGLIAVGFLLSWIGHFVFERNTPALFDSAEDRTASDRVIRKVQVALGGITWSGACFLRLFGAGPLSRAER
jgi:hypothetical protein